MVAISKLGEIGDFQEASQFQVGKSQFECGYFAVAIARSMAEVGQAPTLSLAQVIADAESWYAQYDGSDAITNTNGMSLQQLYDLLAQVGLHFQSTSLDINVLKKWVELGYAVCVAILETSAFDLVLNGNPYTSWHPAGTHVILITGVSSDGNVLVRDSANCTNLNDPNSLRPGPRRYDANKLALVSATVVVPPWMPRPASSTPPAPLPVQPPHIASVWVTPQQQKAALSEWNSNAYKFPGGIAPPYATDIARIWNERFRAGIFDGPPTSFEYDEEDWDGNPKVKQQFQRKRYEWWNGKAEQY